MSIITTFGTLLDLSVDGTNLSTYEFYTYDIRKPLTPRQKVSTIDIPKRQNQIIAYKKFSENTLIAYGYVEGTSYDNTVTRMETLAGALYSDDDVELIPSNQTDRYWNGQYLDYNIVQVKDSYSIVNLEFTCHDPFGYAVTADDSDNTVTTLDDTFVIANSGHYYAYPVITVTFNQAQSHLYIENQNIADNRIDISKSFSANDELELDTKNETIKLNGTSSPIGLGDGGNSMAEFILLAKGNNTIAVGSDDETIDVSVNINFNKTYLY